MSFFYVAFNIINVILAIFFIAETIWIDRIESKNEDSTNPVTTNVLILAITTSLYAIFCFFLPYAKPVYIVYACLLLA